MRRRTFLGSIGLMGLALLQSAQAEQFQPKYNNPQTYAEVQKGIAELKKNIESVQCGGWQSGTEEEDAASMGGCNVQIRCASDSAAATGPGDGSDEGGDIGICYGRVAFASRKDASGTMNVCSSRPKNNKGETYFLIHELAHTLQFCPHRVGESVIHSRETCCKYEREAYRAQCQAMAEDGQLSGISIDQCADYGASYLSCDKYGVNACGVPPIEPAMQITIRKALYDGGGKTCAQETAGLDTKNPDASGADPRIKALLKQINKLSDDQTKSSSSTPSAFPMPVVTGAPGRANPTPTADIKLGVGVRAAFTFPDTALGFKTACDIHQAKDARGNDINPERLCINENPERNTPKDCKKLYDFLIRQQKDARRNDNCDGSKEKLCFDYTGVCTGQGCRTPFFPAFSYTPPVCPPPPLPVVPEQVTQKQSSFYRHYTVTVDAPQSNHWDVSGECYDWYIEKDPELNMTVKKKAGGSYADTRPYEQCEVKIGKGTSAFESSSSSAGTASVTPGGSAGSAAPNITPEWKPASDQKGQFWPQKGLVGPTDDDRQPRTAADPWVADAQTNLSILDMKKAKDVTKNLDDENDITPFATNLIAIRQKASKAIGAQSRTDDFDDTGERGFVSWWLTQQQEIMKMVRQPQVRLLLPSRFITGLDETDALFAYAKDSISQSNGYSEITVHAGSEELGNLLQSLQHSFFLPIQEVRVPVIVPLLSETEANTRIAEWKLWQQENPAHKADAEPFIHKIESYRDAALRVRDMRSVLPARSKQLLTVQKQIRGFYASWYLQNAKRVQQWSQVNVVRTQIKKTWNAMATALLDASACQLHWCSNQRYSLAVYSLLDGWFRKTDSILLSATDLSSLRYRPPRDQSIDFSWLQLGSGSSLQMPVLWPVQVRLTIPLPPHSLNATLPDIDDYPDVPQYADDYADLFGSMPVPDVRFPAGIIPRNEDFSDFAISDAYLVPPVEREDVLTQAQQMLDALSSSFQGDDTSRDNLKGAYCRFANSILEAPNPDAGSDRRIVHIENDLQERIARLFSRFMPNRDNDFRGKADRLAATPAPSPCLDDVPCAPAPGERRIRDSWQWTVRSMATDIQTTYEVLRDSMLPAIDRNPYLDAARSVLVRSMPLVLLPLTYDLSPSLPSSNP